MSSLDSTCFLKHKSELSTYKDLNKAILESFNQLRAGYSLELELIRIQQSFGNARGF